MSSNNFVQDMRQAAGKGNLTANILKVVLFVQEGVTGNTGKCNQEARSSSCVGCKLPHMQRKYFVQFDMSGKQDPLHPHSYFVYS